MASLEKAAEFCAITLNADVCAAFAWDAAESAEACCTKERKLEASLASAENCAGLAAIADMTAGSDASAAKAGSLASCRKFAN